MTKIYYLHWIDGKIVKNTEQAGSIGWVEVWE